MNKEEILKKVLESVIANRKSVPDEEVFKKWKKYVNMSAKELKDFMDSEDGKKAGLSKSKAQELGINSGRQSASKILKMLPTATSFETAKNNWTDSMWYWAKRQNSFNARMLDFEGPLFDDKGKKTRKHLSLLIWGHNPQKT
jgi:hypothetical protein